MIEQWWEAGEHVDVMGRRLFVARMGAGPALTLLHGFPSSSHDWAKAAPLLAVKYALLMPDFLGYGASEKPPGHSYSIHEQADLVEALWEHDGIESTAIAGHDYAVSVVQELLARRAEGRLRTEITAVTLLNGGVLPDLHRPEPVQTALLDPEQGPQVAAAINEDLIEPALAPTFGPGYDFAQDARDMWQGLARDDGSKSLHLLIRYIEDRRANAERWERALKECELPLRFVWGMLDPVSGAHMAEGIRERIPGAQVVELPDVAHWPPLEAPERVASAILG